MICAEYIELYYWLIPGHILYIAWWSVFNDNNILKGISHLSQILTTLVPLDR